MAAPAIPPGLDLSANHDAEIITVFSVFAVLSTLTIATRLWSKRITHRGLSGDDLVLVAAWAVCMGETGMVAASTSFGGLGWHFEALTPDQLTGFAKMFFASGIILPTALALTKISLLMLLNYLFVLPAFRITVRILGAIVIAWWLTLVLGQIFICLPISSHWDTTVVGHCGNQQAFDIGTPIPWIVTDVAILLCPLPVLRQLHVSRAQKLGLFGLFLIGILTCIVSCIRYSTLWYTVEDPTWDVVPAAVWSIVEANVTIITAALVASRPALALFYPAKLMHSLSSLRSGTKSQARRTNASDPYGNDTPLRHVPPSTASSGAQQSFNQSIHKDGMYHS